jgi:DNA mismatch endonuclease (patch repair protein)
MADIFSKKKRSEIMSKIRGRNTSIEKIVFRQLRREGIYFQKHYRPRTRRTFTIDIALPRKKIAVFIDGDFWHGYNFSKRKNKLPKKYWQEKIQGNIDRDRKVRSEMRRGGWRILRIWEHEIIGENGDGIGKIAEFIKKNNGSS